MRALPDVANVELNNGQLTANLKGDARVAPLITLLVQAGGEVEEVRRGVASLEDVFLTLVKKETK